MNLKLTLLALVAVLGFGAATVTAQAAVAYPPTAPGCTFDCPGGGGGGDSYDGNDDYDPFCMFEPCKSSEEGNTPTAECEEDCGIRDPACQINCAPGNGTSIPGNKAGLKLCDAQIGGLAKVTARQIRSISGRDSVQVVAVCTDMNLADQQKGVESLRPAIAKNAKMTAALSQEGYSASDVVGLQVGRTQAVLYVHVL